MNKFKTTRTLYADKDGEYLTDSINQTWNGKKWVSDEVLWARKGEIFERFEITEQLIEEYSIDMSEDPIYIYIHRKGHKWTVLYHKEHECWFEEIK